MCKCVCVNVYVYICMLVHVFIYAFILMRVRPVFAYVRFKSVCACGERENLNITSKELIFEAIQ